MVAAVHTVLNLPPAFPMRIPALLLLALLASSAAAQPPAAAPVLIEGLSPGTYRRLAMMKARNQTDIHSARILADLILADDRLDEAEARLVAALTGERFSLLLRPGPGRADQPAEIRFDGQLPPAARALLREARPLDYRAVIEQPDAAGLRRLVGWLDANAERRAAARAWLADRIEAERVRVPPHASGEWGHYRAFFSKLFAALGQVPGTEGLLLRRWTYEAYRLHDRRRDGAVPDWLYTSLLPVEDTAARLAADAAIDALVPPPAAQP